MYQNNAHPHFHLDLMGNGLNIYARGNRNITGKVRWLKYYPHEHGYIICTLHRASAYCIVQKCQEQFPSSTNKFATSIDRFMSTRNTEPIMIIVQLKSLADCWILSYSTSGNLYSFIGEILLQHISSVNEWKWWDHNMRVFLICFRLNGRFGRVSGWMK